MDVRPSHSAQLCSQSAKCWLCSSYTNQRPLTHLSGTNNRVLFWQNCNMACRETRFPNVVLTCLWWGLALLCVLNNYRLINRDLVPLRSFFKRQGRWNLYLEEWVAPGNAFMLLYLSSPRWLRTLPVTYLGGFCSQGSEKRRDLLFIWFFPQFFFSLFFPRSRGSGR